MCPQEILDKGITVPAAGVRAATNDVHVGELVSKVADFLDRFLQPEEVDLVARLSVWHSFTADLAGTHKAELNDLQRLSVLRLVGERYSMHLLVRQAAQQRLKTNLSLQSQAHREMVEQFAALGELRREAAWERLLAERPNVPLVCSVAQRLDGDSASIDKLELLGKALRDCALYVESETICRTVSRVMCSPQQANSITHCSPQ